MNVSPIIAVKIDRKVNSEHKASQWASLFNDYCLRFISSAER